MNPLAHTTRLPRAAPARVLACGAFLKNRACLVDGELVYWSALHGDLGDAAGRQALQAHPLGRRAAVIGQVHADPSRLVQMTSAFGGKRVVDWLSGEPLPRIC